VEQILEHRGGLLRLPLGLGKIERNIQDPYSDYNISLFARDIKSIEPVPAMYSYSHVGYAVTYWLFERLGGLDEFAQRCLFGPLGMEQTGWTISDLQIEQGHGLDGRPQPVWHTNALSPAMGLKSSLNDVMTYLRSVFPTLVKKTPGPNSTLRKEISKLSRAGIFKVVDGWFLISSGSSLIYFHNGRTGGHQVSVAFIPGSRKGVVVFSNGALGSNDLCLLVLHMLVRAKNAGSNKGQEFLKM
jgi:CubicO group peptidase (beta-lactamase class C family)